MAIRSSRFPDELTPGQKAVRNALQTMPQFGQGVLNARRNFGVDDPANHTIPLKFTQLCGKHLLSDRRQEPLQFAEPPCARHQVVDDKQLPFTSDHRHRARNRAAFNRHGCVWHGHFH